jgi:hypothetical protein
MDVPFIDLRMDAIANPHLNDDTGAIIMFRNATSVLEIFPPGRTPVGPE